MTHDHTEQITHLQAALTPVQPDDTMAEAGRKVMLAEFTQMLSHEAGSRTGENIEAVHDMRVAIRRLRSALRLLRPYLKWKEVRAYNRKLRQVAWALGAVRDLDVMIDGLRQFQATLDFEPQAQLQIVLEALDQRRLAAREDLNEMLDRKAYRHFLRDFSDFLTTPGVSAKSMPNGTVVPFQVRHVLPPLIYERLAAVRAYDTVLAGADGAMLHALRIEFKRLRYLLSLFEQVLGSQVKEYLEAIKSIQDQLGHLNDIAVAHTRLDSLLQDLESPDILAGYFEYLELNSQSLKDNFAESWLRFNTRKMQQKLASAVLSLS